MRLLNVMASSDSPEAYTKINQRFTEEIGEPIKIKNKAMVQAEPDALEKLKRLQGGGR